MNEHDSEPVRGLPASLPDGETILWQGAPHWKVFARRVLKGRMLAAYFGALVVWSVASGLWSGSSIAVVAVPALRLAVLGTAAGALLVGFAWLVARTTVYTITTRRVVMRMGIALSVAVQIPFSKIDGAGLKMASDGSGDIALALRKDERVPYFLLWPHARPWRLARAEPALRGIADAAPVAQVLGRALAASALQAPSVLASAPPPPVVSDTTMAAAA